MKNVRRFIDMLVFPGWNKRRKGSLWVRGTSHMPSAGFLGSVGGLEGEGNGSYREPGCHSALPMSLVGVIPVSILCIKKEQVRAMEQLYQVSQLLLSRSI